MVKEGLGLGGWQPWEVVWEHLSLAFWGQEGAPESSGEAAAGMVGARAGVGEGTALDGSQQSGSEALGKLLIFLDVGFLIYTKDGLDLIRGTSCPSQILGATWAAAQKIDP